MPTSIHHGPPGSYKSFTLVQRFAVPALISGRAVVTNIRGFDCLDRVIEQFPEKDFSLDARIIWIDTTTQAGRDKMGRWFHWCPFGALIIIDEVQQIYPDRRDFKLESLDKYVPDEGEIIEDIGLAEGRPEDVFTAYDKQRHYNWDIFCSTPNIAKVKKEIRQVSEWAFRHRDLSGLLPWKKHTWIEHQHDPESSGKVASHRVGSPTQYKADPRIFNCYASTATGEHVKSKAGRSILEDKKLLSLLVLIVGCLVFMGVVAKGRSDRKAERVQASQPVLPAVGSAVVTAVDHVDHYAGDRLPSAPVSVTVALTRDLALKWSAVGISPEEIATLPIVCKVMFDGVRCDYRVMSLNSDVLLAVRNRVCFPVLKQYRCFFLFPMFLPPVDTPKDTKEVLADSLPF
jgi:zona occludens toxin